jgi:4,4'-diaponeurosporenoate glycosyltransferase
MIILPGVTLALWFAGWIVLGRVRGCHRGEPGQSVSGELLSIIIPARNEEQNLPALLRSIAAQSLRPREIIVVDDASTDRTAGVARESGATIIASQPLPDGWRGKTWACHQGAQAAAGSRLLFLDADTWFEPDGLRRVLAEFEAAGAGVLSVAPHHCVRNFHEQFSAFFNLVMLAGTGAFTILGDRLAPRGLLGQFMLIERAAYQRVGGHEAVKGRILENFWLAEHLRASGVPLRCRSGRGVFAFRMYPHGLRELVEGWTKGFASGAGQTPLPLLLLVIAWLTGLMLAPLGLVLTGDPWLRLAVYGLCAAQVAWLLRRVGTFHWSVSLFYPAPLIFYFAVFARSAWRAGRKQEVAWKGRRIRGD